MLKGQSLIINDDGTMELTNSINLDYMAKDNAAQRRDNPKGMSRGRTMMAIASIDPVLLNSDIDGIAFLNAAPGSKEERDALNRFLFKFPECRTSESKVGRRIL